MLAERLARLVCKVIEWAAFAVPTAILDALGSALLPHVLGTNCLDFRGRFATGLRNIREVLDFEHDVFLERILDLSIEVQDRQLQQADGLL